MADQQCGLDRPALGRYHPLGALYNVNQENFVGASLWKSDTLSYLDKEAFGPGGDVPTEPPCAETVAFRLDASKTGYKYVSASCLQKASKELDIGAELSVAAFAGAVSVGGSGKLFKTNSTTSNEASVTMVYQLRTKMRRFDGNHAVQRQLTVDSETIKGWSATHYVDCIEYGADVLIRFSKKCSSNKEAQQVSGKLHMACEKIPGVSASASGHVRISDADQELIDDTHISVDGDIELPFTPVDLSGVNELIKMVPDLIGKVNHGLGKPMKYTLRPVGNLFDDVDIQVQRNDAAACRRLLKHHDDMVEAVAKVQDLIASTLKPLYSYLCEARISELLNEADAFKEALDALPDQTLQALYCDDRSAAVKQLLLSLRGADTSPDRATAWADQQERKLMRFTAVYLALHADGVRVVPLDAVHTLARGKKAYYVLCLSPAMLNDKERAHACNRAHHGFCQLLDKYKSDPTKAFFLDIEDEGEPRWEQYDDNMKLVDAPSRIAVEHRISKQDETLQKLVAALEESNNRHMQVVTQLETKLASRLDSLVQCGTVLAHVGPWEQAGNSVGVGQSGTRTWKKKVEFPRGFREAPVVSIGIRRLDTSRGDECVSTRINCWVGRVESQSFDLFVETFCDTKLFSVGLCWTAIARTSCTAKEGNDEISLFTSSTD